MPIQACMQWLFRRAEPPGEGVPLPRLDAEQVELDEEDADRGACMQ